jgi:ubiquinone/menaquinone biosynthesis C-methylase UbiE
MGKLPGRGKPANIHFDWMAPVYDFLAPPAQLDLLRELLRLPVDGRLLDAGGGTGRVSFPLRHSVRTAVILDFSRPMLKQSKKKQGLVPLQADAGQLPFPPASFERIMTVDSLHHFADQQGVINELLRVLKPGGLLVIEEFNIHKVPVKLLALLEKLILMGSCFSSPDRIREMVAASGSVSITSMERRFSVLIAAEKPAGE